MPTPDEITQRLRQGDFRAVRPCADGTFSGRFDDIAHRLRQCMERHAYGLSRRHSDTTHPWQELMDVAALLTANPHLRLRTGESMFELATARTIAQMWAPQDDDPAIREHAERVAEEILRICRREERYALWILDLVQDHVLAKRNALIAAGIERLVWVECDPLRWWPRRSLPCLVEERVYTDVLDRARWLYQHVHRENVPPFEMGRRVWDNLHHEGHSGRDAFWGLVLERLRTYPKNSAEELAPEAPNRMPFAIALIAAEGRFGMPGDII